MIPVTFPECNVILGMGQNEYAPLQAYRAPDGQTICAFRLSPQELREIAETGTIWISVLTFNQPFQPIGLSTQCPFERPDQGEGLAAVTSKEKLTDWLRRWHALKGELRFREAAEEIERLQRENEQLRAGHDALHRSPAPSVLTICTAYESGYGLGLVERLKGNYSNPYDPVNSPHEARAWAHGYDEGIKRRAAQPPGVGPLKLDTDRQVFFYEQDHYYLSNFSAFNLVWSGRTFATSEAAYHWEKFGPAPEIGRAIELAPSAHEAFKLAERHKGLRRKDWDAVKVEIMRRILRAKAEQHEYVRRKLLETGDRELIENSWRDDYWGWGENRDGQNMLGKLWMEVRAELLASALTKEGGHG